MKVTLLNYAQQGEYLAHLGALTNPKLFTKQVYLGKHFMFTTYWMIN